MTSTLPGFTAPVRRDYGQVARMAVDAARSCDRSREAHRRDVLNALATGPMKRWQLRAVSQWRCTAYNFDLLIDGMVTDGVITRGPQGYYTRS